MPEGDTATLTEADDAYCLTDAEIQRALKGAAWQRYGVLGDSLAEGLGEDSSGYLSAMGRSGA